MIKNISFSLFSNIVSSIFIIEFVNDLLLLLFVLLIINKYKSKLSKMNDDINEIFGNQFCKFVLK